MKSQVQKKEPLQRLKPMLAELIEESFDDTGWLFEIKYDGYRALAGIDGQGMSISIAAILFRLPSTVLS